jgi:hypothetical protein
MKEKMIKDRVTILKDMDSYVMNLVDEEVYDTWWTKGIPNEPDEEDFRVVAENDELWEYICKLFYSIIHTYDILI